MGEPRLAALSSADLKRRSKLEKEYDSHFHLHLRSGEIRWGIPLPEARLGVAGPYPGKCEQCPTRSR
jgi:hypothetical protein